VYEIALQKRLYGISTFYRAPCRFSPKAFSAIRLHLQDSLISQKARQMLNAVCIKIWIVVAQFLAARPKSAKGL
jgi:hypothetical protein